MSSTSALLAGRRRAENEMRSGGTRGIIRRATGATVTDPVTLEESNVMVVIVPDSICKARMPAATDPGVAHLPGYSVVRDESIVSFPVDAPGSGDVTTGDVWECTANPLDPSLVGVKLKISGVHHQTFATARRFPVEELS